MHLSSFRTLLCLVFIWLVGFQTGLHAQVNPHEYYLEVFPGKSTYQFFDEGRWRLSQKYNEKKQLREEIVDDPKFFLQKAKELSKKGCLLMIFYKYTFYGLGKENINSSNLTNLMVLSEYLPRGLSKKEEQTNLSLLVIDRESYPISFEAFFNHERTWLANKMMVPPLPVSKEEILEEKQSFIQAWSGGKPWFHAIFPMSSSESGHLEQLCGFLSMVEIPKQERLDTQEAMNQNIHSFEVPLASILKGNIKRMKKYIREQKRMYEEDKRRNYKLKSLNRAFAYYFRL